MLPSEFIKFPADKRHCLCDKESHGVDYQIRGFTCVAEEERDTCNIIHGSRREALLCLCRHLHASGASDVPVRWIREAGWHGQSLADVGVTWWREDENADAIDAWLLEAFGNFCELGYTHDDGSLDLPSIIEAIELDHQKRPLRPPLGLEFDAMCEAWGRFAEEQMGGSKREREANASGSSEPSRRVAHRRKPRGPGIAIAA